jgi:hypothetical protein
MLTVLINRDFNSILEETDLGDHRTDLTKFLRWAGRTIASIAAIWFLATLIGAAITEGADPITMESGTLVLLGVIAVAGGILSWWKDAISGVLLFLTSVGLGIHISCYAGHSHFFAWTLIGLPYLVASILMMSSWRLLKKSQ